MVCHSLMLSVIKMQKKSNTETELILLGGGGKAEPEELGEAEGMEG